MQYAVATLIICCIVLFVIVSKQSQQLDDLSDKYFEATERLQMTKTCLEAMEKDRDMWAELYIKIDREQGKICEEKNNEKTEK